MEELGDVLKLPLNSSGLRVNVFLAWSDFLVKRLHKGR